MSAVDEFDRVGEAVGAVIADVIFHRGVVYVEHEAFADEDRLPFVDVELFGQLRVCATGIYHLARGLDDDAVILPEVFVERERHVLFSGHRDRGVEIGDEIDER